MKPQAEFPKPSDVPIWDEKRKYFRHRLITSIYICKQNGSWHRATTYEISLGGLSVAATSELAVGEIVRLATVVGKEVYAFVRRRKKTMYGFEFLKLSAFVHEKIQKLCEGPLFKTWMMTEKKTNYVLAIKIGAPEFLVSGALGKNVLLFTDGTRRRGIRHCGIQ